MTEWQQWLGNADDALLEALFGNGPGASAGLLPAYLDGFLTAIAISPEPIPPAEWLAYLWGGGEPDLGNETEAEVVRIALARLEAIDCQIENGTYLPRLRQAADGGVTARDSAGEWANGFMAGHRLRTKAWLPLLRHPDGGMYLLPIVALCRDADEVTAAQLDNEMEIEIHEQAPDMLGECVMQIAAFWHERKVEREQTREGGLPGPSRNDPCPCGSGRNYKRCCGASA